jgi:hypothetical protein
VSSAVDWQSLTPEENVTDPFPTLVKGKTYSFELCSFSIVLSSCSVGGKCNKLLSLIAADVPGPPLALERSSNFYQALTIGLKWTNPADTISIPILRYEIEASNISDFSSFVQSANSSIAEVAISAPMKGTQYYCRVRAVTAVGRGMFSAIYGPIVSNSTPSSPSMLTLLAGEDTNGNLFLASTWSIPDDTGDFTNTAIDVIVYELDFSNSSSFAGRMVSVAKAPALSSKMITTFDSRVDSIAGTGMQDLIKNNKGQTIFCRVRARTAYGVSSNSSVLSRKLAGLPGTPISVKVQLAQAPLALNISWAPPPDKGGGVGNDYSLLRYQIQLRKGSTSEFDTYLVDPNRVFLAISTFRNLSLIRGDTYIASIFAENDVGLSRTEAAIQQEVVGLSSPPDQVVLCSFDGGSLSSGGGTLTVESAGPLNLW